MQFPCYCLLLLSCLLVQCAHFANTYPINDGSPLQFEYFGQIPAGKNNAGLTDTKVSDASKSEYTKTGTTIVGMCCRDGIVLGADTRSTGGPLVMDKNKLKIHSVSQYIRCCAAGTSADCTQITRKACHHLGMLRIEHELSGESTEQAPYMDPVAAAVNAISNRIRTSRSDPKQRRKVESVLILGGVDKSGPALYQIDKEGVPQRVSFGALGSGATDALAVLEHERRLYRTKRRLMKVHEAELAHSRSDDGVGAENNSDKTSRFDIELAVQEGHSEDISVTEAVNIVRKAVRSGILNDLGSGSHVDLCVISFDQCSSGREDVGGNCTVRVRQWREEALSGWDANRIFRSLDTDFISGTQSGSEASMSSRASADTCDDIATDGTNGRHNTNTGPSSDPRVASYRSAITSEGPTLSKTSSNGDSELGRRVFSRFRPVKRLFGENLVEETCTIPVDEMVALNVELIE